jgi:NADPH-dependent ferric siderophore reductase
MPSVKGKLVRLVSGVLLARATVVSVEAFGGFRRLVLRCDARGFAAGAKVQLLLPSDDVRTYTPIGAPEGMVLLAWMGAGGPGSRWMARARPGDEVPFIGPQRSLVVDEGPAVIVGDETSAAVAAAFAAERPGEVHAVLQSDAASDLREAAGSVGLDRLDVVPRGDTASAVAAVSARLAASPGAVVALTGGSELVADVRSALRGTVGNTVKAKAYWVPGRRGLD